MMKKRGVTSTVSIVLLIVGLIIGAGATYLLVPPTTTVTSGSVTTTTTTATVNSSVCTGGPYTIGLLTDLTGDLKAQGINTQTSAQMAVAGLNNYTSAIGCAAKFNLKTEDYASDPTKTPGAIQALHSAGVAVTAGPLDSASILAILGYVNTNHIVMISPSSTAFGFALPNDYLFRTVPSDFWQGKADAAELSSQNVKAIIVINRIGIYADGLANSTIVNFKAIGGAVVDHIRYDAKTTTDFTSQLQTLQNDWTAAQANTAYAGHVAIYAVSFEEIDQLFLQADHSFPSLVAQGVIWYGSDGTAQDTVISGNATAGAIVARVELPSTVFAPPNSTKYAAFYAAFLKATGQTPTIYQTGAFDDTWLAGLAILAAGKYDGAAIQAALPAVAANYYGVLGNTALDANGDINAFPGYAIYKVAIVANLGPTWVLAGFWNVNTGKVTWYSPL